MVKQVNQIEHLLAYWEGIVALSKEDSSVRTTEELLMMFLSCLQNGVVFVVHNDEAILAFSCALLEGKVLSILFLPKDGVQGYAKICLQRMASWAREHGCTSLQIASRRFNGSAFRHIEKTLGFKRKMTIFTKDL